MHHNLSEIFCSLLDFRFQQDILVPIWVSNINVTCLGGIDEGYRTISRIIRHFFCNFFQKIVGLLRLVGYNLLTTWLFSGCKSLLNLTFPQLRHWIRRKSTRSNSVVRTPGEQCQDDIIIYRVTNSIWIHIFQHFKYLSNYYSTICESHLFGALEYMLPWNAHS